MAVLQPLRDKVIVKLDEAEAVTEGGIYLPDQAQKKPSRGEVVAIGPGRILDNGQIIAPAVKVGEKVIFSKYGGSEVEVDGEDFTVLDEDQIYAIVRA